MEYGSTKEKRKADDKRLSYLGTQLDLLLDQKKRYQQALWQVSDEVLNMNWDKVTDDDIEAADKRLVAAARGHGVSLAKDRS